jgi:hypothetical protein
VYEATEKQLNLPGRLRVVLEQPPKWHLLKQVLKEIEEHAAKNDGEQQSDSPTAHLYSHRVLILVRDERTALQLRTVLQHGGEVLMRARFKQYLRQHNTKIRRQVHKRRICAWILNAVLLITGQQEPLLCQCVY